MWGGVLVLVKMGKIIRLNVFVWFLVFFFLVDFSDVDVLFKSKIVIV